MTENEAIKEISTIVEKVCGRKKDISITTDLRKDNILDSLDMLIFMMEFENITGIKLPETETMIAENWYAVKKLCSEIVKRE